MILVGPASARIMGGSPLRADTHEGAIGKSPAGPQHRQREHDDNGDHAATALGDDIPRTVAVAILIVGVVRVDWIVLKVFRASIELAIERIVVTRRIRLMTGIGERRRVDIVGRGRGMGGPVAVQRMHGGGIIRLRLGRLVPGGALHPGRRAGGGRNRAVIGPIIGLRQLILIAPIALNVARLQRQIGPSHRPQRIGLSDQTRKLRQGIAVPPGRRVLLTAAIVVVFSGKRSILISISHRDDASPSGKPPTFYKRTGRCRMPLT